MGPHRHSLTIPEPQRPENLLTMQNSPLHIECTGGGSLYEVWFWASCSRLPAVYLEWAAFCQFLSVLVFCTINNLPILNRRTRFEALEVRQ